MDIEISLSNHVDDEAVILDGLSESSDPLLGPEPSRICVVARAPDARVVGGLVGKTGWNYLEVSYLWVDDRYRKSGCASRLMSAAEAEAIHRGCRHARVDTFDFQAVDFYRKLGYQEFGRLSGYAGRFDRHFFYKALSQGAELPQLSRPV